MSTSFSDISVRASWVSLRGGSHSAPAAEPGGDNIPAAPFTEDVKGRARQVATWVGRGTFKVAALVGAFVIIVALWFWDASVLTRVADQNLRLIREVTRLLPADWASKTESALRIFGADRALLLVEGIAVAKLVLLAVAQPFRRRRP